MRSSNQILHGDHGERIIFYKADQVPDLVKKKLCDTNADARFVCGTYPSCLYWVYRSYAL